MLKKIYIEIVDLNTYVGKYNYKTSKDLNSYGNLKTMFFFIAAYFCYFNSWWNIYLPDILGLTFIVFSFYFLFNIIKLKIFFLLKYKKKLEFNFLVKFFVILKITLFKLFDFFVLFLVLFNLLSNHCILITGGQANIMIDLVSYLFWDETDISFCWNKFNNAILRYNQ